MGTSWECTGFGSRPGCSLENLETIAVRPAKEPQVKQGRIARARSRFSTELIVDRFACDKHWQLCDNYVTNSWNFSPQTLIDKLIILPLLTATSHKWLATRHRPIRCLAGPSHERRTASAALRSRFVEKDKTDNSETLKPLRLYWHYKCWEIGWQRWVRKPYWWTDIHWHFT